jgi:hypothetical protein
MELMLYEEEYMPQTTSAGTGFRVAVTPYGKRPNPTEQGFYVAPGFEIDLAFRLRTVVRMPPPYESQCWDTWQETSYQPLYFVRETNEAKFMEDYSYEVGRCCTPHLEYASRYFA